MGGAAWFGLALISGSKLVLSLAVVRHLANWWFLSSVEKYITLLIVHTIDLTSHLQPAHAQTIRRFLT